MFCPPRAAETTAYEGNLPHPPRPKFADGIDQQNTNLLGWQLYCHPLRLLGQQLHVLLGRQLNCRPRSSPLPLGEGQGVRATEFRTPLPKDARLIEPIRHFAKTLGMPRHDDEFQPREFFGQMPEDLDSSRFLGILRAAGEKDDIVRADAGQLAKPPRLGILPVGSAPSNFIDPVTSIPLFSAPNAAKRPA